MHEATPLGVFWRCAECEGRVFTVAVLRKQLEAGYVNRLWREALDGGGVETATTCPACERRMREVAAPRTESGSGSLHLDVCTGCHVVWFDVHELESARAEASIPVVADSDAGLPPRAREILALARIEQRRRDYEYEEMVLGGPPTDFWGAVVTLFGVPVEVDRSPFSGLPVVTLAVASALFGVTMLVWHVNPDLIEAFGFLPADPWRHWGATWLTSFFLHDSLLHLLGNALFLIAFGPNLENRLGRAHLGGLLLLSAVVGDLCHWLWDPRSAEVVIGASGGVSGVVTLYALLFPRTLLVTALRFGIFFYWIRFRAVWGFVLWLGLQALLIWRQLQGDGHVSGLSHAGGIAVGAVWWWFLRRQLK
jgi:membrane associated rhomboid family serine protease